MSINSREFYKISFRLLLAFVLLTLVSCDGVSSSPTPTLTPLPTLMSIGFPTSTPTETATPTPLPPTTLVGGWESTDISSICLEVTQTCELLPDGHCAMSIEAFVAAVLSRVGFAVGGPSTACDATLRIESTMSTWGTTYVDLLGNAPSMTCYTGATLRGILTLTSPDGPPLVYTLARDDPIDASVSGSNDCLETAADAEVLDKVLWLSALTEAMVEIWGGPILAEAIAVDEAVDQEMVFVDYGQVRGTDLLIEALDTLGRQIPVDAVYMLRDYTQNDEYGRDVQAWRSWWEVERVRILEDKIDILLDDDASEGRVGAAEELMKARDPLAYEAMLSALVNNTGKVQVAAATYLGLMRDSQAVEPLVQTLASQRDHEDTELIEAIANALIEIDDPAAVEPLIAIVQSDDQYRMVKEQAIIVLGALGDPRAIGPLLEASTVEDDAQTRTVIANAILAIDDPGTVELMIDDIRTSDWMILPGVYEPVLVPITGENLGPFSSSWIEWWDSQEE